MTFPWRFVGLTFLGSMKVTMPRLGGSPRADLVAATACRIISDAIPAPSFLNAEHIQAPPHWCLTYFAKGKEVTQTALPLSVSA